MSSIRDTVFKIIADEARIDIGRVTLDASLDDLNIESMDVIQIIFEIEDHFNITFPERDAKIDSGTVRGLVDAVERLVEANNAKQPAGLHAG